MRFKLELLARRLQPKAKIMTYLTEDVDIHNEQVLEDLVTDFDSFLRKRNWDNCNAIIDNLRDMKQYELGIQLAKRLCAAKMTIPADYGEENVSFREEDNPLKDTKVEGYEEEQEIW